MPDISRRAVLLGGFGAAAALAAGTAFAVEEQPRPVRDTPHPPSEPVAAPAPTPAATTPVATTRGATTRAATTPTTSVAVPTAVPPAIEPGRLVSGSFTSAARLGARTGWTIAYPLHLPKRLRVLVVLHGRGVDHTAAFGRKLGLERFLAQVTSNGAHPFAIASVDGGPNSFWHRRSGGSDAGAMIVEEFLPLLGRAGLDVSRVGLMGVSMGGFGALWLATQMGRRRVAAVVAESPALWHRAADTPAGAFDGAADFAAHTIFGRERQLAGIPLRIDCGLSDPFAPATRDLRAAITPRPAGGLMPGEHNVAYWRRMAPAQLAFVAAHLAR